MLRCICVEKYAGDFTFLTILFGSKSNQQTLHRKANFNQL